MLLVALKQERVAGQSSMVQVKHIISQVLRAVEHMHERGVVHRYAFFLHCLKHQLEIINTNSF